jgi:hypothetical protein
MTQQQNCGPEQGQDPHPVQAQPTLGLAQNGRQPNAAPQQQRQTPRQNDAAAAITARKASNAAAGPRPPGYPTVPPARQRVR